MKGIDRFQAALSGEKADIPPLLVGNYNNFLCNYYGVSVQGLLDTPALFSELSIRFADEFGFDSLRLTPGYIFYGCGPELGVQWQFVEDNFPGALEGSIGNQKDLDAFQIPREPSGFFKKFLDMHRALVEGIGSRVYVRGTPLGPFSAGCFLRGLQNFLLDSAANPDFFRRVMGRCVELSEYFVEEVSRTGVRDLLLNEVYLTPGNLNPRFFQQEVVPFIQSVLRRSVGKSIYFYQQDFIGGGALPDGTSLQGLVSALYYGTRDSLEVLRKGARVRIPGHPPLLSISGRALVQKPAESLLDFIRQGLEIFRGEGILNPSIYLVSVQSASREEAMELAAKIRRIDEFRKKWPAG